MTRGEYSFISSKPERRFNYYMIDYFVPWFFWISYRNNRVYRLNIGFYKPTFSLLLLLLEYKIKRKIKDRAEGGMMCYVCLYIHADWFPMLTNTRVDSIRAIRLGDTEI